MDLTDVPVIQVILSLIAFLGLFVSPVITYLVTKNKVGAEVRLLDISTLRGWKEAENLSIASRNSLRKEITTLYGELEVERTKRRAIEKRLEEVQEALGRCQELLDRGEQC